MKYWLGLMVGIGDVNFWFIFCILLFIMVVGFLWYINDLFFFFIIWVVFFLFLVFLGLLDCVDCFILIGMELVEIWVIGLGVFVFWVCDCWVSEGKRICFWLLLFVFGGVVVGN